MVTSSFPVFTVYPTRRTEIFGIPLKEGDERDAGDSDDDKKFMEDQERKKMINSFCFVMV